MPSIGISEIIKYNNNSNENIFIITSLRANSIIFIEFDKNFDKIIKEEVIVINERIRDIIYTKKNDNYYLVLEDTPAIGIMKISKK